MLANHAANFSGAIGFVSSPKPPFKIVAIPAPMFHKTTNAMITETFKLTIDFRCSIQQDLSVAFGFISRPSAQY